MTALESRGAFDAMFTAGAARLVAPDGRGERLPVGQWAGVCDEVDRDLFTDHCIGPTLDIGCGPGRLVEELVTRGVPALGIDTSQEAVRLTRLRGAWALLLDVFDEVPGVGNWSHVLLADGNIGIGGDPVRLLRRLARMLGTGGTIAVEVAPHGTGVVREERSIDVDGVRSDPFPWALLGLDAIVEVADNAGLVVKERRSRAERNVVVLAPR